MNSAILDEAVRRVVRKAHMPHLMLTLALSGDILARQFWHTEVLHQYRLLS